MINTKPQHPKRQFGTGRNSIFILLVKTQKLLVKGNKLAF